MARDTCIRVRLTHEEKFNAFQAAKRGGYVGVSEYIREVIRRASRKFKKNC